MKYQSSFNILLIILSSLLLLSCDDNSLLNSQESTEPSATLDVKLENSLPFAFSQQYGANHVVNTNITITSVAVRSAEDGELITLTNESQTFNLFELTNGKTGQILSDKIAPGLYDQVILSISDATLILANDQKFDLDISERTKEGIAVNLAQPIELSNDVSGDLSMQFNVAESFDSDGETGGFKLNPTMRAINNASTGKLTGSVVDEAQNLDRVRVWLTDNSNVLSGINTGEHHEFAFSGLRDDNYTLHATKAGFDTTRIEGISVEPGMSISHQISLTQSQSAEGNQTLDINDVRINEVGTTVEFEGSSKWIEFKNTGSSTVDLSDRVLCIFGIYPNVGSLTVLSGNSDHTIEPGGYLVVAWQSLGTSEGEVGLYKSGTVSFGNSDQILDYMQYGAAVSPARDNVAAQAGIWPEDEFVPTVADNETYAFFDDPNASSPIQSWWPGIPTPGAENQE